MLELRHLNRHLLLKTNLARNECLTAVLSLERFFQALSRHHELVLQFNVGLKSLLHLEFHGDLVYKFIKINSSIDFLTSFEML